VCQCQAYALQNEQTPQSQPYQTIFCIHIPDLNAADKSMMANFFLTYSVVFRHRLKSDKVTTTRC